MNKKLLQESDKMQVQTSLEIIDNAKSADELRQTMHERNKAFDIAELERVVIVGAAEEGERFAAFCQEREIQVVSFCDDNPEKKGNIFHGCPITSVDALQEIDKEIPVIIASHRVLKAQQRIKDMGFTNIAPLAMIEVLAPHAFPPHMFYDGWFEDLFNNLNQYRRLNDLLADDYSRRVLDSILAYRLTLDAEELASIVEWDLYGPKNLVSYSDDEIYVDGGTFDGDTIRLFKERVGGKFQRVIGFEPDTATFERLKANFADDPRVEAINKGLHRREGILKFDNAGTRGSILTEGDSTKGIEVPVTGLDEVLNGERVSYIKMNIEGAELEALMGAKQAINNWRPKLAISAYHRPSDIWQVPFLIRDLRSDYKLYLRQHDGGVIESVLYAL